MSEREKKMLYTSAYGLTGILFGASLTVSVSAAIFSGVGFFIATLFMVSRVIGKD